LESFGHSDQNTLDLWRQEFNDQRPHEALGMGTPRQVYQNSPRKYDGGIEDLDYVQLETRRVNKQGCRIDPRAVNFVRADIGPKKTDAAKKIKKAA